MKQKRRQRDEPCPICQHYHDYEHGEPCLVCGHTSFEGRSSTMPPSAIPSEVIAGHLFLGSYDHASRCDMLKMLGIEYILNVDCPIYVLNSSSMQAVPTASNLHRNVFQYYHVEGDPPNYDECCGFLEKVRKEGRKVLVHCMTGQSKSATIVVYYLMKIYHHKLDQAYDLVTSKRPSISFSDADAARLKELELLLFGSSSSDFNVPSRS